MTERMAVAWMLTLDSTPIVRLKDLWPQNILFKANKATLACGDSSKGHHSLKPSLITKTKFTYVKDSFEPLTSSWGPLRQHSLRLQTQLSRATLRVTFCCLAWLPEGLKGLVNVSLPCAFL